MFYLLLLFRNLSGKTSSSGVFNVFESNCNSQINDHEFEQANVDMFFF